jgi:polyhydroxybutyrate depolymerase
MMKVYLFGKLAIVSAMVFCCQTMAQDDQTENFESITVDGGTRYYRLYVPESYEEGTPVPLVFDFHGSSSNPTRQEEKAQFETLAAEKGFVVVTPKGEPVPSNGGRNSWNVDLLPGDPDDVSFVRAMIEELSELYSIDGDRIYATGHSGGGRMSSRVACSLSDAVAAVAPNAGIRWPEVCDPVRPVPIITFHGKQDSVNHYEVQPDSPSYWLLGVEDSLAGWVKNNQCNTTPIETPVSETRTRVSYQECKDGGDIVFYRSETDGHVWSDIATNLIWEFFESHPMNSDM